MCFISGTRMVLFSFCSEVWIDKWMKWVQSVKGLLLCTFYSTPSPWNRHSHLSVQHWALTSKHLLFLSSGKTLYKLTEKLSFLSIYNVCRDSKQYEYTGIFAQTICSELIWLWAVFILPHETKINCYKMDTLVLTEKESGQDVHMQLLIFSSLNWNTL